ncbi:MAG TPA: hypothetical protein VIW02_02150, partial [Gammaproteobacteria bacterium]
RFEASEVGGRDAWESIYETRSQVVEKALDYEDKFRQKFELSTWKQHDISEGGISISLGETLPEGNIRVGELIGYRHSADAHERWNIGAVRWMQFLPGRGLSLGIRKLTDNAVAVGGRAVEGTGAGGEYFRLLLSGPLQQDAEVSVIAPAAIFDVGTVLLVNDGQKLTYLRLSDLADTSRSFSQFTFGAAQPPKMKTPLKQSSTFSPF